ncbi:MFS general substrate transporter [Wolfiporia cocos MD-104 SS10]|uniref:MFS general substrate transporter n=1 Tax=Wolfiporia cocos (strain MD-104) TaxID=742152 RepID=A0A2H3J5C4_WOLCO|nr:MFS general substrate transporter [Wolfiporia cocos MD-104 SS10]
MTVDEETPLLRESPQDVPPYNGQELRGEIAQSDDTKSQVSIVAVVAPIMLGTFLIAMDQTIVASTYASIGSEFQHLENTSWITTGYMLTLTSFQPLYGKLSDIFGRKPCILFALSVFALGCLLCGLAQSMTSLIVARAIAGIGGGGIGTVGVILMSDVVPLRNRGTWQGVANIVFASGQGTGAPLGGLLADTIGWRWAFLIQVPLTMLAFISVAFGLKLPKRDTGDFKSKLKRVDFAGAITLVVAVFALLLGLDRGGNIAWSDRLTLACFAVFAVLFAAFGVIEWRVASEPFAPRHIVANRTLIASYLCNFFMSGANLIIIFHTSLYLQAVRGFDPSQVGLALIPSVVGGAIGSVSSGLIMRATGRYYALTVFVYFLSMVGMALIAGVTGPLLFTMVGLGAGLAVMNLGGWAGLTTTLIALIANAGAENQAVATAVSYLFRSLGSVVLLSVATTLFQETLRMRLHERLSGDDVQKIIMRVRESLSYLEKLEPATREAVVQSYQDGLQVALWFAVILGGITVLSSVFIKEKPLAR